MGDDADLPLPELEDGYHFIAALMEVGPVSYAGWTWRPSPGRR